VSRLIINADDFGLTAGVNRAILELHRSGVLTSATLMARAGATSEAVGIATATPTLGVGCHVVLVDGRPVLPPGEIPSLVDRDTGCFAPSLTSFLTRLFTGRVRTAEIEAEAFAQMTLLLDAGVKLTHFDSHKHTHMFPPVLEPLLRAARRAGMRAVRNPFEPEWAVRVTPRASVVRTAEVVALRSLGPFFRRLLARAHFLSTDGTIAVAGTGTFDSATVRALLGALPEGTWELVTHPGYNDADLARVRTRLREARDQERLALAAVSEFPAIELVSFAALCAPS
jgi:chitin disaccharide deacetylase